MGIINIKTHFINFNISIVYAGLKPEYNISEESLNLTITQERKILKYSVRCSILLICIMSKMNRTNSTKSNHKNMYYTFRLTEKLVQRKENSLAKCHS